jgi:hypothetical protein
MCFDVLYLP